MIESWLIERNLIACVNAMICVVCIVILACRLNSMSEMTRFSVRAAHALGLAAMVGSGARPLIGEWPGYASLLVAVYILAELWSSRRAWRGPRGDEPPVSASNLMQLR